MNIEKLLSTRERVKILGYVIYKPDYVGVSEVARDIGLSKGLVSKYLGSLVKEGILERADGRFGVRSSVQAKAVKIFLNLNTFGGDFFKKYRFVRSAGLYGSFVKGTNTENSDIDLWVLTEKAREGELAKMTAELKRFGDVRPFYLTKEKVQLLKKEDATFYHSLLFGSIVIYGDGIEKI